MVEELCRLVYLHEAGREKSSVMASAASPESLDICREAARLHIEEKPEWCDFAPSQQRVFSRQFVKRVFISTTYFLA
jgi:hypothetical protein